MKNFSNHHKNDHKHKDKYVFGTVTVGTKGQIVIPKEARVLFNLKPGDKLLVLGDKNKGLAIVKTSILEGITENMFKGFSMDKKNGKEGLDGGVEDDKSI